MLTEEEVYSKYCIVLSLNHRDFSIHCMCGILITTEYFHYMYILFLNAFPIHLYTEGQVEIMVWGNWQHSFINLRLKATRHIRWAQVLFHVRDQTFISLTDYTNMDSWTCQAVWWINWLSMRVEPNIIGMSHGFTCSPAWCEMSHFVLQWK